MFVCFAGATVVSTTAPVQDVSAADLPTGNCSAPNESLMNGIGLPRMLEPNKIVAAPNHAG